MINYAVALLYFSIPKINLITIGNNGIRIQDILFIYIISSLLDWNSSIKKPRPAIAAYITYLIILGIYIEPISGIIEPIRLLQYVIIGKFIYEVHKKNNSFLKTLLTTQLLLAFAQYYQILPSFDTGRGVIYSKQYAGSFGVSSEFTFALIIITTIAIRNETNKIAIYLAAMMNGTQSAIIIIGKYLTNNSLIKITIYISAFVSCIILSFYIMNIDFNDIRNITKKELKEIKLFSEYGFVYGEQLSLIHRSSKAVGALEVVITNPIFSIFGFGFGAIFSPLDYGLIRIFVNFGFMGLYIFYTLIKKLPIDVFFSVLAANIMFDGLWSSTVGPLIFMTYFIYRNTNKQSIKNKTKKNRPMELKKSNTPIY